MRMTRGEPDRLKTGAGPLVVLEDEVGLMRLLDLGHAREAHIAPQG